MIARGAVILLLLLVTSAGPGAAPQSDPPSLAVPSVGSAFLTVVTPTMLEVLHVVGPHGGQVSPEAWRVTVDGATAAVERTGVRRRVVHAPLRNPALRVGHVTFIELAHPLREGKRVRVELAGAAAEASFSPLRRSPAVHVNQEGYHPEWPKRATIGYWLGTLGELEVPRDAGFRVLSVPDGREVATGELKARPDRGFPRGEWYQRVLEANFSSLRTPGEYVVQVPGLGVSFPFRIHDGLGANLARTYALGLYHQRCGEPNRMPFTRFQHGACHVEPAEVPAGGRVDPMLGKWSRNRGEGAPMASLASAHHPYVRTGRVDVRGGHHDAGDYSKYAVNSAQLVHALVLGADAFPGVVALDNLGVPESGDGVSDMLQMARLETEFLARMQDADGGFYFLVYPRDRPYEDNVLPDRGDPQVVYPKNTSATAAAAAALAQASSSPAFARAFPGEAARYREAALKGWAFLEKAWARHGVDGAYQRLTHYGDLFGDRDEVAWAATELFLATGDERFEKVLRERFSPGAASTRRWGWWRLFEGYGCAIRSYALAPVSGRAVELDPKHLAACRRELVGRADDLVSWAISCAYVTSFPEPTRRVLTAGWYFPGAAAFELAAAAQVDADRGYFEAMVANFDFECGRNPNNVCFLSGLGWRRQREMVHQYAQNDRRALPPSGIPVGSLQGGFSWIGAYGRTPGELTWPPDAAGGYPLYDRWGDAFNVSTEVVASIQAQSLAAAAWMMARTPYAAQAWRPVAGRLAGTPADGLTLGGAEPGARIIWEAEGHEPIFADRFQSRGKPAWIEAEAAWPDGRRMFGVVEIKSPAAVSRPPGMR